MSDAATQRHTIPPWTLGWRLQRALDWAEVSVQEMAAELDVSRSTISRWCNDRGTPPRSIYLRAWAAKCNVPLDWLMNGDGDNGSHITAIMQDRSASRGEILAHAKPIADPDTVAALRRDLGYTTRTGRRAAPRSAR